MVGFFELTALALIVCRGSAQNYYGPQDPRVEVAFSLDHPTNGVTTANGRIFHTWARADGSKGAQMGEFNVTTNTSTPYPNEAWNSYYQNASADPATVFFHVNSLRIGPDGKSLWAIDVGSPGTGIPNVPHGPKVVQIDTETNEVTRVYDMTNYTWTDSFLDDIRFHPPSQMAYLTDAGVPALWLLNLTTGDCIRVLENDKSTTGFFPASGEGKLMHTPWWAYQYYYADQMEVSPDGEWFYFQPDSGGMSRVRTDYLTMAFQNKTWARDNLSKLVEPFSLTPPTGGTAIDADGNVYVSDVDSQRILKIYPNATSTILVQDPRLLWVDAMWIDNNQKLWMPAAQLNRGIGYNNGTNLIQYPLYVYTMDIGIGPSPLDHP